MGDMWVSPVPIIEINPTELINWVIAAWCISTTNFFRFFKYHLLLFRKSTEQIVKVNRDHRSLQKFEMCGLFPLPEKQNSKLLNFQLTSPFPWPCRRFGRSVEFSNESRPTKSTYRQQQQSSTLLLTRIQKHAALNLKLVPSRM